MSDPPHSNELSGGGGSSSSLTELPSRQALVAAHNAYCPITPTLPSQSISNKRSGKARRNSTASQVNVDFFDPAGVRHLNRTLSQMSTQNDQQQASSVHSDATLTTDGPFDFEKTLRNVMKKYVSEFTIKIFWPDIYL